MHFLKQHQSLKTHWGDLAYYHRTGSRIPVLFLHGTGCESRDWGETFAHMPHDAHLLAFDFQGHGESDVPARSLSLDDLARDTVQLIDHLSLETAILVGHSLGGMVAMSAASRCDRIAGLVLLEGWTNLKAAGAFAEGRFYGNLSQEAVYRIQRKAQHTMDRFTPEAWQAFWESVLAFDGSGLLKGVKIPVQEVYGEKGRLPETAEKLLVPPNPLIEWTWVPDAGHYLPHERPRDVAQACMKLLDRANTQA